MLVRSDPFREVDRLLNLIGPVHGSRPLAMPMDGYRDGDHFAIELDLPGISADATELTVEGDTLTIKAERARPSLPDGVEMVIAERPFGSFSRQIFLGEHLDTEHIEAHYADGVLRLTIPIADHAKPRRIEIHHRDQRELATTSA